MSCSCLFVVKLIILGNVLFLVLLLLVFSWLIADREGRLVVFWLSLGLRNSWTRLIC